MYNTILNGEPIYLSDATMPADAAVCLELLAVDPSAS